MVGPPLPDDLEQLFFELDEADLPDNIWPTLPEHLEGIMTEDADMEEADCA